MIPCYTNLWNLLPLLTLLFSPLTHVALVHSFPPPYGILLWACTMVYWFALCWRTFRSLAPTNCAAWLSERMFESSLDCILRSGITLQLSWARERNGFQAAFLIYAAAAEGLSRKCTSSPATPGQVPSEKQALLFLSDTQGPGTLPPQLSALCFTWSPILQNCPVDARCCL